LKGRERANQVMSERCRHEEGGGRGPADERRLSSEERPDAQRRGKEITGKMKSCTKKNRPAFGLEKENRRKKLRASAWAYAKPDSFSSGPYVLGEGGKGDELIRAHSSLEKKK